MNHKIALIISFCITILLTNSISNTAYSVSNSVKSQEDYIFTLDALRSIDIMIENFSDEPGKDKFNNVKALFRDASENLYGQNFDISYQKFRKMKFSLIDLLDGIAQKYLDRTKEILDSTQKESFEILLKYSNRNSTFTSYFRKPFDPLHDIKPYDASKFHYFYTRGRIETYLRDGYKNYHEALKSFKDPEIDLMRKKKNITPASMNFIILRYLAVIENCRQAKQLGIEIHKIMNTTELGRSMTEFGVSGKAMDPIFDYRIPDQYKVDANDNLGLSHALELKRMEKRKQ